MLAFLILAIISLSIAIITLKSTSIEIKCHPIINKNKNTVVNIKITKSIIPTSFIEVKPFVRSILIKALMLIYIKQYYLLKKILQFPLI